ncbi:MAG: hypothetical protein methR_P2779 [Methyloprofundus sp.]|nr:MAG: hypothetical protein methR_P2779 [Methyloprofundus sp.]
MKSTINNIIFSLACLIAAHNVAYAEADKIIAQAGNARLTQSELDIMIADDLFVYELGLYEIRMEAIKAWQKKQIILQEKNNHGINPFALRQKQLENQYPAVKLAQLQKLAPLLNAEDLIELHEYLVNLQQLKVLDLSANAAEKIMASYPLKNTLTKPKMSDFLYQHISGSMALHRGKKEAPIQLVVFSDFDCFYCAKFAEMIAQLEQRYQAKLNIVFRHTIMDGDTYAASAAAECAHEQEQFWAYHDALFATQDQFTNETFISLANQVGLNKTAFKLCLQQDKYRTRIQADANVADQLKIYGTPTIFINGIRFDGLPELDEVTQVIDAELSS